MILVLGADGYIGVELMNDIHGYAVDNYYKRDLMRNLNIKPLFETKRLGERKWEFSNFSVCDYPRLSSFLAEHKPDAIIDLSEQPSAPYSMRDKDTAVDTVNNNLIGTINLIFAIRDHSPDTHLIKLGTMGQFGTPNFRIEEGFMNIEYLGREDVIPIPKSPYSIYHLSKGFDSDALLFACRVWGIRVTDLQQGFVHGISSYDNPTRFCYDGIFGTALNRFMIQAIAGHPLTVYGAGGQTRGIIHIKDTVQCIKLAIENPPERGEYRAANQLTEWKSINELADMVVEAANRHGLTPVINHYPNPRKEKETHFYEVTHKVMSDYGLKPNLITIDMISETMEFLKGHKGNVDTKQILNSPKWEAK